MRSTLARLQTPVFLAVCALGILVAILMGVVEIGRRPPVELGEPMDERRGLVSVVTVEATNRTEVTRCPEIRIAARDRDDADLEEHVAQPIFGVEEEVAEPVDPGEQGAGERLEPGETRTYRATFRELTEADYDEDLKEFAAYVWEAPECP